MSDERATTYASTELDQDQFGTSRLKIPIVLFAFNRPEATFDAIQSLTRLNPPEVWIYIDGPRRHVDGDTLRVSRVLVEIMEFEWPCAIRIHKNNENKGTRAQIRDGLNHFFDHHRFGLILEDQIRVSPTAINYINDCVAQIDGIKIAAASLNNFHFDLNSEFSGLLHANERSYLSSLFHGWGWITSREGWTLYNDNIEEHCDSTFFQRLETRLSGYRGVTAEGEEHVSQLTSGVGSWSDRYQLSLWWNGSYCITPPFNLAIHEGFNAGHTRTLRPSIWQHEISLAEQSPKWAVSIQPSIDADIEELSLTGSRPSTITCALGCGNAEKVFCLDTGSLPRMLFECHVCGTLQTSRDPYADHSKYLNERLLDSCLDSPRHAHLFRIILNNAADVGLKAHFFTKDNGLALHMSAAPLSSFTYTDSGGNNPNARESVLFRWSSNENSKLDDLLVILVPSYGFSSAGKPLLEELLSAGPAVLCIEHLPYQGQSRDWVASVSLIQFDAIFFTIDSLQSLATRYDYSVILGLEHFIFWNE